MEGIICRIKVNTAQDYIGVLEGSTCATVGVYDASDDI
jgi:hypothetical protein